MSGRILDFKSYIGGADNVIVEEMTPSTQKTFNYDYGQSVTSFTFAADMQTIVVDSLAYDRITGDPNFADSNVLGNFANSEIAGSNIVTTDAAAGNIKFTIPANRYTGQMLPDARKNVPITVISFRWTDTSVTPNTTEQHRYAILERFEPDVVIGDPKLDSTFTPIGVGAVTGFSSNAGTDTSRTAGTYTITGLSSGQGTGATFQIFVLANGTTTIDITARGTEYNANDTIELLDSSMGGGGGADITVTVSSVS